MRKLMILAVFVGFFSLSLHSVRAAEPKYLPGIIENRGDKDGNGRGDQIRGLCNGLTAGQECARFKLVRLYEDKTKPADEETGRYPIATDTLSKENLFAEAWEKELASYRSEVQKASAKPYSRLDKLRWTVIMDVLIGTFTLPSDIRASRTSKKSFEALDAITSSGTVEVSSRVFEQIEKHASRLTAPKPETPAPTPAPAN